MMVLVQEARVRVTDSTVTSGSDVCNDASGSTVKVSSTVSVIRAGGFFFLFFSESVFSLSGTAYTELQQSKPDKRPNECGRSNND